MTYMTQEISKIAQKNSGPDISLDGSHWLRQAEFEVGPLDTSQKASLRSLDRLFLRMTRVIYRPYLCKYDSGVNPSKILHFGVIIWEKEELTAGDMCVRRPENIDIGYAMSQQAYDRAIKSQGREEFLHNWKRSVFIWFSFVITWKRIISSSYIAIYGIEVKFNIVRDASSYIWFSLFRITAWFQLSLCIVNC